MNVAHVLVAVLLTVMMALVVYNSSELHGRQTNAKFPKPVNQLIFRKKPISLDRDNVPFEKEIFVDSGVQFTISDTLQEINHRLEDGYKKYVRTKEAYDNVSFHTGYDSMGVPVGGGDDQLEYGMANCYRRGGPLWCVPNKELQRCASCLDLEDPPNSNCYSNPKSCQGNYELAKNTGATEPGITWHNPDKNLEINLLESDEHGDHRENANVWFRGADFSRLAGVWFNKLEDVVPSDSTEYTRLSNTRLYPYPKSSSDNINVSLVSMPLSTSQAQNRYQPWQSINYRIRTPTADGYQTIGDMVEWAKESVCSFNTDIKFLYRLGLNRYNPHTLPRWKTYLYNMKSNATLYFEADFDEGEQTIFSFRNFDDSKIIEVKSVGTDRKFLRVSIETPSGGSFEVDFDQTDVSSSSESLVYDSSIYSEEYQGSGFHKWLLQWRIENEFTDSPTIHFTLFKDHPLHYQTKTFTNVDWASELNFAATAFEVGGSSFQETVMRGCIKEIAVWDYFVNIVDVADTLGFNFMESDQIVVEAETIEELEETLPDLIIKVQDGNVANMTIKLYDAVTGELLQESISNERGSGRIKPHTRYAHVIATPTPTSVDTSTLKTITGEFSAMIDFSEDATIPALSLNGITSVVAMAKISALKQLVNGFKSAGFSVSNSAERDVFLKFFDVPKLFNDIDNQSFKQFKLTQRTLKSDLLGPGGSASAFAKALQVTLVTKTITAAVVNLRKRDTSSVQEISKLKLDASAITQDTLANKIFGTQMSSRRVKVTEPETIYRTTFTFDISSNSLTAGHQRILKRSALVSFLSLYSFARQEDITIFFAPSSDVIVHIDFVVPESFYERTNKVNAAENAFNGIYENFPRPLKNVLPNPPVITTVTYLESESLSSSTSDSSSSSITASLSSSSSTEILPVAYAHVNSLNYDATDANDRRGVNISWGPWNNSTNRHVFTFDTEMDDADYNVVTDRNYESTNAIHIFWKTTTQFTAEWENGNPEVWAGTFVVYASTPTKTVN